MHESPRVLDCRRLPVLPQLVAENWYINYTSAQSVQDLLFMLYRHRKINTEENLYFLGGKSISYCSCWERLQNRHIFIGLIFSTRYDLRFVSDAIEMKWTVFKATILHCRAILDRGQLEPTQQSTTTYYSFRWTILLLHFQEHSHILHLSSECVIVIYIT